MSIKTDRKFFEFSYFVIPKSNCPNLIITNRPQFNYSVNNESLCVAHLSKGIKQYQLNQNADILVNNMSLNSAYIPHQGGDLLITVDNSTFDLTITVSDPEEIADFYLENPKSTQVLSVDPQPASFPAWAIPIIVIACLDIFFVVIGFIIGCKHPNRLYREGCVCCCYYFLRRIFLVQKFKMTSY